MPRRPQGLRGSLLRGGADGLGGQVLHPGAHGLGGLLPGAVRGAGADGLGGCLLRMAGGGVGASGEDLGGRLPQEQRIRGSGQGASDGEGEVQKLGGVRGSPGRLAGGGPQHQLVQGRGHSRGDPARGGHVPAHVRGGNLQGRARVRAVAREHLVGHDAYGVHVAALVHGAVAHQLGRGVAHGAQHGGAGRVVVHGAREAEVRDLHLPVRGEQDVLGLDVAVHQAGAVRPGEAPEHRHEQLEGAVRVHRRLACDDLAQGGSVHELEHQVQHAVVGAPLVQHGHHVGVVEPGGGLRLAFGPGDEAGVVREVRVHDLQGHGAVEALVQALVDGRRSPVGDPPENAVAVLEQGPHTVVVHAATGQISVPVRSRP